MALNQEQIKKDPQRITKIKPFIDQYNWKEIDFPPKNDRKKFELNNNSIALNILCVPDNTEEIRHASKSIYNLKHENQVILLMITNGEKWHYLAVKKLSALLRWITSKQVWGLYCLNCLHSYSTKDKLKNLEDIYVKIMIIVMYKCIKKTIRY